MDSKFDRLKSDIANTPAADPLPAPAPEPTPAPVPTKKLTATAIGSVIIVALLAGAGAWTQYVGPLNLPTPAPAPVPPPVPVPTPKPTPADVWQAVTPPDKNEVPGLKLPPPMEVKSSQKFIQITATCNKPVKWLIAGRNPNAPIEALQSPLINSVLIFPGSSELADTIIVMAYAVTDTGDPTDPAITVVKVTGDPPTPAPAPPEPEPMPTPTPAPKPQPPQTITPAPKVNLPSKVHVTFYTTGGNNANAIATNKDLRDWLTANGHKFHEITTPTELKVYGLDESAIGKQPPLVFIQAQAAPGWENGTLIGEAQPLVSVQQVKTLVTRATGGK